MIFNSFAYIVFLLILCFLYYSIPQKFKNHFLLIASFLFYINWNIYYAIPLIVTILSTYICGIKIEQSNFAKNKKLWLLAGFFINLSVLFFFKYYNFFAGLGNSLFINFGRQSDTFRILDLILPVGISFYTFQSLGYIADVYGEKINAERSLSLYGLFILFFPYIASGPIGRAPSLIPQFKAEKKFCYEDVKEGATIFAWGLFKKIVIADRLAILVNTVFNDVYSFRGIPLLISSIGFLVQLYCDFSAYSDMAVGSAKILGFDLIINFKAPFLSKSIGEFWRRWHISLSSWFRDYLYIPLGGSRKGKLKKYRNQIIVFLVSGLWHGAGLTFVIWGLLNGIYIVLGEILMPVKVALCNVLKIDRDSLGHRLFQIFITFSLATLAFIFFRANSIEDALYVIKYIFYPNLWLITDGTLLNLGLDLAEITILLCSLILLACVDILSQKTSITKIINRQNPLYRWLLYVLAALFLLVFGIYGDAAKEVNFLYFQF